MVGTPKTEQIYGTTEIYGFLYPPLHQATGRSVLCRGFGVHTFLFGGCVVPVRFLLSSYEVVLRVVESVGRLMYDRRKEDKPTVAIHAGEHIIVAVMLLAHK